MKAYYLRALYQEDYGQFRWYRDLTCTEAKRLKTGTVLYATPGVDSDLNMYEYLSRGLVVRCRLTRAPKMWMTFPGCFLHLTFRNKNRFWIGSKHVAPDEPMTAGHNTLVIPVRQSFDPDTPPEVVADWVLENEMQDMECTSNM